jgi:hypothetical protein
LWSECRFSRLTGLGCMYYDRDAQLLMTSGKDDHIRVWHTSEFPYIPVAEMKDVGRWVWGCASLYSGETVH